jgi:hypothetical protein
MNTPGALVRATIESGASLDLFVLRFTLRVHPATRHRFCFGAEYRVAFEG